jgi:hypothetical protein
MGIGTLNTMLFLIHVVPDILIRSQNNILMTIEYEVQVEDQVKGSSSIVAIAKPFKEEVIHLKNMNTILIQSKILIRNN